MEILSGHNPLNKKYPFICVTNGEMRGEQSEDGVSGRAGTHDIEAE
jgi:hypothetical protein